jgi:hypothetical protein
VLQGSNGITWDSSNHYVYFYDGNGDNIFAQTYAYSGGVWSGTLQDSFTYNTAHMLLTDVTKSWNGTLYVYSERVTNAYDTNGNLIFNESDGWYQLGSAWVFANKFSYGYDAFNNNISIYEADNVNTADTTGASHYRTFKYYRQANVQGIPQPNNTNAINIYPNPTNGLVYLSLTQTSNGVIELYDINGNLLLSQQTANSPSTVLNLQNFAAGIYVLRYKDENGVVSKKLVKE